MLLQVLDGNSALQQVIVHAQEAQTDKSGTIAVTAQSQLVLAANTTRSGWVIQNRGVNPMYINDLGAAASTGPGSFVVQPGGFFPPYPGHPISTTAVEILGTAGDAYTVREW